MRWGGKGVILVYGTGIYKDRMGKSVCYCHVFIFFAFKEFLLLMYLGLGGYGCKDL